MGNTQQKTVRFDSLVDGFGAPEQVTLWTAPEENREFMKAVEENRVVTVAMHNVGTSKDYGLIGFHKLANTIFVVFPKALPYSPGTKVVGLKYEKLAEAKAKGPIHEPMPLTKPGIAMRERPRRTLENDERSRAPKIPPKAKAKERPKPAEFQFQGFVDIRATQRVPLTVTAPNQNEAGRLLKTRAEDVRLDLSQAKITRRISRPVKKKKE
jgi:hypothetical protein